jgi:hypothetical protein
MGALRVGSAMVGTGTGVVAVDTYNSNSWDNLSANCPNGTLGVRNEDCGFLEIKKEEFYGKSGFAFGVGAYAGIYAGAIIPSGGMTVAKKASAAAAIGFATTGIVGGAVQHMLVSSRIECDAPQENQNLPDSNDFQNNTQLNA